MSIDSAIKRLENRIVKLNKRRFQFEEVKYIVTTIDENFDTNMVYINALDDSIHIIQVHPANLFKSVLKKYKNMN